MTRQQTTKGRAIMARLSGAGISISIGLLALMACLIVLQVSARNLLDLGLPWADELARFCCIGLVFLSIPSLVVNHQMVAVTLVPDMLGPGARRMVHILSELATLVFAGFTLWGFAAFLPRAGKFLTPAMGMPNWGYYAPALIGTTFLTLAALFRIWQIIKGQEDTGINADKEVIL
ncbi:TRAP transporter small permease [Roseibium algae]|uniref:TRAP transporter small permease protein n=1 Tax=Roseibium algae TaxID=3123038 RepID=A0ABU8TS45_9HYPH